MSGRMVKMQVCRMHKVFTIRDVYPYRMRSNGSIFHERRRTASGMELEDERGRADIEMYLS